MNERRFGPRQFFRASAGFALASAIALETACASAPQEPPKKTTRPLISRSEKIIKEVPETAVVEAETENRKGITRIQEHLKYFNLGKKITNEIERLRNAPEDVLNRSLTVDYKPKDPKWLNKVHDVYGPWELDLNHPIYHLKFPFEFQDYTEIYLTEGIVPADNHPTIEHSYKVMVTPQEKPAMAYEEDQLRDRLILMFANPPAKMEYNGNLEGSDPDTATTSTEYFLNGGGPGIVRKTTYRANAPHIRPDTDSFDSIPSTAVKLAVLN